VSSLNDLSLAEFINSNTVSNPSVEGIASIIDSSIVWAVIATASLLATALVAIPEYTHWIIVRSALGRVGLRLHPISEERFWSKVMKVYPKEVIAHWMIVRSALGRVGLRLHPISEERFWSKVMKVYEYMSHTFNDYMRQVIEEQDSIGSDREYVEILDKVRMRRQ